MPETQVLITIVSGMLSSGWSYHPITWLRRVGWQKRLLAEFGQVAQKIFFPSSLYLTPHISFAPPVSVTELLLESSSGRTLPPIINRAKTLMARHIKQITSGQGKEMEIPEF